MVAVVNSAPTATNIDDVEMGEILALASHNSHYGISEDHPGYIGMRNIVKALMEGGDSVIITNTQDFSKLIEKLFKSAQTEDIVSVLCFVQYLNVRYTGFVENINSRIKDSTIKLVQAYETIINNPPIASGTLVPDDQVKLFNDITLQSVISEEDPHNLIVKIIRFVKFVEENSLG